MNRQFTSGIKGEDERRYLYSAFQLFHAVHTRRSYSARDAMSDKFLPLWCSCQDSESRRSPMKPHFVFSRLHFLSQHRKWYAGVAKTTHSECKVIHLVHVKMADYWSSRWLTVKVRFGSCLSFCAWMKCIWQKLAHSGMHGQTSQNTKLRSVRDFHRNGHSAAEHDMDTVQTDTEKELCQKYI